MEKIYLQGNRLPLGIREILEIILADKRSCEKSRALVLKLKRRAATRKLTIST